MFRTVCSKKLKFRKLKKLGDILTANAKVYQKGDELEVHRQRNWTAEDKS